MRERGKLLGPPYNEVYTNMVNVTKAWHSRLSSWPTKSWEGGGLVTLAGDAAHPMTFRELFPSLVEAELRVVDII